VNASFLLLSSYYTEDEVQMVPLTFEITVAGTIVGSVTYMCTAASMVFSTADTLPDQISLVHIF
jgi:hypothetical protein